MRKQRQQRNSETERSGKDTNLNGECGGEEGKGEKGMREIRERSNNNGESERKRVCDSLHLTKAKEQNNSMQNYYAITKQCAYSLGGNAKQNQLLDFLRFLR